MNTFSEKPGDSEITALLKSLEERIEKIEKVLNIETPLHRESEPVPVKEIVDYPEREERLEYQIGQFWFAKAGIIILIIGIAFFLTFPYKNLSPVVPCLFGFVFAFLFFICSGWCKKTFNFISGYLYGGGLVLLYFTAVKMHFFGNEQLIRGLPLEIFILIIISAIEIYLSLKRKSSYLAALSLTLGYVTSVLSNDAYFIFISVLILSGLAVYIKLRFEWDMMIFYGIILTYTAHFIWFINNPVINGQIQTVTVPQSNLLFLISYSLIFAAGNLMRKKGHPENASVIVSSLLNAAGCYGLFSLISLSMDPGTIFIYNIAASILFLVISVLFWVREQSRYSTFIFAILGYLALSVAIIVEFKTPGSFIWLCWQSLLVVSTAIWFRSKYIILANFIIYLIIFFTYLLLEGKIHLVSLSFGIVALLSARILNWKKDRLELKTDQMRNAYLLSALFIIPYALYFAMPDGLISVSWIGAAILYYLLSLALKNKKYRWMALLTLLLTIVYVFVIGITSSDPTYKIVSFILLGAVLISVSLIYTKYKKSVKHIIKS